MIHVSWIVGSFRGLFYDAVMVKKLYRKFPTTCSLSHLALTPLKDVKICKDYSVTLCIASLVRLLVNYVKGLVGKLLEFASDGVEKLRKTTG